MVQFPRNTLKVKPFVSINGVEIDIENTPPGSITLEQYRTIRANSPGFALLYSKLNNEALIAAAKHNLDNNYGHISPGTYEWALQNILVPELLKRLESKEA